MDDEQLKLKCLELAFHHSYNREDARNEAQRIFDWLKGRGENVPSDVQQALQGAPAPKARIVGTEGHLEPPFDDYVKE